MSDPALPAISFDASADEACALLRKAGWRLIGTGHWAWIYGDGSNRWAARVTPVDPAYRMFAEDCLAAPQNRFLPRMAQIVPLRRDGFVVVMERLWPADTKIAGAFCVALGIRNESGFDPTVASGAFAGADDPDFVALRARVRALLAKGATRYRLWGGADIKPDSVMVDATGAPKLVDPLFLAGKKICEALLAGRTEDLSDFSRAWLADFLTIPVFRAGGDAEGGHAELVEALRRL